MATRTTTTITTSFCFFELPAEIRDQIYIELAVPPGGRGLGCLSDCERLASGCFCAKCTFNSASNQRQSCLEDCEMHPGYTSRHFEAQYKRHRNLNTSLASKKLYQELTDVFFSRNMFEFHNTTDMLHFLRMSPARHADLIKNVRMVLHGRRGESIQGMRGGSFHGAFCPLGCPCGGRRRSYLTCDRLTELEDGCNPLVNLAKALDLLAKCPNLRRFAVGFEFRTERELVMERFAPWLSFANADHYPLAWHEFYNPTWGDAIWRYRPSTDLECRRFYTFNSPLAGTQELAQTFKSFLRACLLKSTDVAAVHDAHMHKMFELNDIRFSSEIFRDLLYCMKQVNDLGRLARAFATWRKWEQVERERKPEERNKNRLYGRAEKLLRILYPPTP